ncbi:P1 family peptidase [Legionella nagasakiensis]|uniref:P1 family peptidase n=1 Tax=Legionella nagasakiensis TaxID=535290 RepID=UPI00105463F1|nr:P1 family peptidase [Legionella nagasakiensis]
MEGLKISHFTNREDGTGASVFLFEQGAVGSYVIAGAASASHEIAVLDPEHSVPCVHGLMLTGGSTFGLYAAEGVVRYLAEKNIGFQLPHATIPLVPASALYDLSYRKPVAPSASAIYEICSAATENNTESGVIGAGTGATVGKLVSSAYEMKSGLGRSAIQLMSGLEVIVYAAVNAVGDVYDNGKLLAGARFKDGRWANSQDLLLSGQSEKNLFAGTNTTLVAIFTNAKGDKAFLKRIAKMAVAGCARAISPVFSPYDGDTIFCFSLGDWDVGELILGTIVAEQVRLAIIDAVKCAEVIKES